MPYFLVWSLCIKRLVHHEVCCISWSCLLSFLCNPFITFLIYEIFRNNYSTVDRVEKKVDELNPQDPPPGPVSSDVENMYN